MDKNLVHKVNKLINNCIVTDEKNFFYSPQDGTSSSYWTQGKVYSFTPSDQQLFCDIITNFEKEYSFLKSTVSGERIGNLLIKLIHTAKTDNKNIVGNDIISLIVNPLKDLPCIKTDAFQKIYGLTISSQAPITIGNFTFYNLPLHNNFLEGKYGTKQLKVIQKSIDASEDASEQTILVSTTAEVRDNDKAYTISDTRFEQLQNILRFFISFFNPKDDIGIFNYKKWHVNKTILMSPQGFHGSRLHGTGSINSFNLETLLEDLKKIKIDPIPLIEAISTDSHNNLSQIQQHLLVSINLLGRALYDNDKTIGFLESMMAIEALIQTDKQSIVAKIAEYCALLLEHDCESRISMEHTIKKLYKIRSQLAHGTLLTANKSDINAVFYYASSLIYAFLTDESLKALKTDDDLQKYIQRLRYT